MILAFRMCPIILEAVVEISRAHNEERKLENLILTSQIQDKRVRIKQYIPQLDESMMEQCFGEVATKQISLRATKERNL